MSGPPEVLTADARSKIAVGPESWRRETLVQAVQQGGGTVVARSEASALIWSDPAALTSLPNHLADNLAWVQLPYAGVETALPYLDDGRLWTCGKGVYAEPVAEMALAMALTGLRNLHGYGRATSWEGPQGRNLRGANVVIVGGGGIAESLLKLLEPFETNTTVLRRSSQTLPGADTTATLDQLHAVLPQADVVFLAVAVTPETVGLIGATELELMADDAWVINVARGAHVVTDDLVAALASGSIGGAGLDVTDPEPLPDGHPLWTMDNCIITPHVGNTPEMGLRLLADRVEENTRRWIDGQELLGPVDIGLGY